MNKLDDFIDIFGLNVGKDEVREDKNGNKYKLYDEMETHKHGNDMSKEEMEELHAEEELIEDDTVEIDGRYYKKLDDFMKDTDTIEIDGEYYTKDDYMKNDIIEVDGVKYIEAGAFVDPMGDNDDGSNFDNYHGEVAFEDEEHVVFMDFQMVDKQVFQSMENNSFE